MTSKTATQEDFRNFYETKEMSISQIAKRLGSSFGTVRRRLIQFGIKLRKQGVTGFREKNSQWIGGKIMHASGHLMIYFPEHHRASTGGGSYVFEHIVVAEKMLGRSIESSGHGNLFGEVVHHINGNKADNRPENLAVMTRAEHGEFHAQEDYQK